MARDVCIKAGSFCPVCRGTGGVDCWHEASQFHAGSGYLDKLLKAQDRIKELEAALAHGNGYVGAFYEMAEMLGIPAQPLSPRHVYEEQIKPRIAELLTSTRDKANG